MANLIKSFLHPFSFESDEQKRTAQIIHQLCILIGIGIIISIITNLLDGYYIVAYILIGEEIFIVLTYSLNRRKKIKSASIILCLSLLLMAISIVVIGSGDGIHDVSMLVFPGIIIIASIILDKRLFTVFSLLVILSIAGIIFSEVNGILTSKLSKFTTYYDLIDVTVIIVLTAIIIWVLSSYLRESLTQMHLNEKYLAEANRELEIQAKQLRVSEEKYRLITDNVSDLITQVSNQGLYTYVSPSYENILGFKSEELIGKNPNDYIHPEDLPNMIQYVQDAILNKKDIIKAEIRSRDKYGNYKWFEASFKFLYDDDGTFSKIQVVSRDVSERKMYEEALQLSAKEWQSTFDALNDSIFIIDTDRNIKLFNKATLQIFNKKPQDVMGCHCWEVVHNSSKPIDNCPLLKMEQSHSREHFLFNPGNKWLEMNIDPILDEHGKIIGAVHITSDITKRKMMEDALEAEKEQLLVTLRSIGDGVITTDVNGTIVLMNNVAEMLTGWTMADALGVTLEKVFNIIAESTREKCDNPVNKILQTGGMIELGNHTTLISLDGSERTISDSGAPIRDKNNKIIGVVIVFRDVTEKQLLEESLRTAQKLESVGILAAGIAHDFNNLLNGIFGYIDLAQQKASDSQKVKTYLDKALGVFERARILTQQLFTFAKGSSPVKKIVAIDKFLKNNVSFVLSGSNIIPEYKFASNLLKCEIDENQIGQAISNIVLNAKQASADGGKITISADNLLNTSPIPGLQKPADYVYISIQDYGIGIDKNYITKVFDPFFTTKQDKGGLGLTTAYSIIKKHEGHIKVESEIGKGSIFFIYLPALTQNIVQKSQSKSIQSGNERILLMDDEPYILEVARDLLEILGYRVECTSEGSKAILLFKEAKEASNPFDIVILDLTIQGGMGGKETIQKLLEIDPNVKAIASSGYSEDPVLADPLKFGFKTGLKKPYRKNELASALKETISS